MKNPAEFPAFLLSCSFWRITFALAHVCVLAIVALHPAQAQTFTVLHNFTQGTDGGNPSAGLVMDRGGNLYGTAANGGIRTESNGVVYELAHRNGAWLFNPIYNSFSGNGSNGNGAAPEAVTIGPNGSLYGTTETGGPGGTDAGTVFNVIPGQHAPRNVLPTWTLNVLHDLGAPGGSDGALPSYSVLVFDQAGNLYGTTAWGGGGGCGGNGCGMVFELSPTLSGQWRESILYTFSGGNDGSSPSGGVIFDSAGNLYGTASGGGTDNCGTVFKLTRTSSGWVETTLHLFQGDGVGDGCVPASGLTFDGSGNLCGTTYRGGVLGGNNGAGTVFELIPRPDGSWAETVLYAFTNGFANGGPLSRVAMDATGNLYGSTYGGGINGLGAVFKLTLSGGSWLYTSLHDFGGQNDGEFPVGNVLLDSHGNIYGTAVFGGLFNWGTAWEITP